MIYVRNFWKILVIVLTVMHLVFFFVDICVHVDIYCFLFCSLLLTPNDRILNGDIWSSCIVFLQSYFLKLLIYLLHLNISSYLMVS